MMDNKITRWWLALDPALQYMYWIISFCAMLSVGIGLVVVAAEYANAATFILPMLLGIGAFVMLTVRWPHLREHDND